MKRTFQAVLVLIYCHVAGAGLAQESATNATGSPERSAVVEFLNAVLPVSRTIVTSCEASEEMLLFDETPLPFDKAIHAFVACIQREMVIPSSEDTLYVQVEYRGKPESVWASGTVWVSGRKLTTYIGNRKLYLGAHLSGTITFSAPHMFAESRMSFEGYIEPPKNFSIGSNAPLKQEKPSGAPFLEIFVSSFIYDLEKILVEIGGLESLLCFEGIWDDPENYLPDVWNVHKAVIREIEDRSFVVEYLSSLLGKPSREHKAFIVEVLGDLRDKRAVQPLIALMDKANPFMTSKILASLRKISDPSALNPLENALRLLDLDDASSSGSNAESKSELVLTIRTIKMNVRCPCGDFSAEDGEFNSQRYHMCVSRVADTWLESGFISKREAEKIKSSPYRWCS